MKILYCSLFVFIHLFITELKAQERNTVQLFLSGLDSIRIGLKIPGVAVAVMKEDSTLLNDALGYADLKNKIKVTPNTTFRIASITKTFTFTLIMQLVEQGKLSLQTPIPKFGIDLGDTNITVKKFTYSHVGNCARKLLSI